MRAFAFIMIAILAVLLIVGFAIDDDAPPSTATYCSPEGASYAWAAAKEVVRRNLRAPASAQFPNRGDPGTSAAHLGGCRFDIVMPVDAQNSFGALLRSTATLTVDYDAATKTWRANDVIID